jgi:hypothetical protein
MWSKEKTRQYNKRYAQSHREQIRIRHREYMRKKRHSKIYKSYAWMVSGLILVRKSDKTISVEPLSIRSNVSQKIIELSGLD